MTFKKEETKYTLIGAPVELVITADGELTPDQLDRVFLHANSQGSHEAETEIDNIKITYIFKKNVWTDEK